MYTEYQPSRLLAPYIDNYWEFKGTPEYGMRIHILPDGCTDFIFTLGEAVSKVKEETLVMQPYRSYFVGPMTKYSELVTYAEFVHQFGVRFLPCGLSGFTKLPLHEFANYRVSTNEMQAVFDSTFIERLCEQNDVRGRIQVVEEYLLAYLAHNYQPVDSQVAAAVNIINQSGGKRSVRSLMDEVCLCQRHFERKFKHNTGFTYAGTDFNDKVARIFNLFTSYSCNTFNEWHTCLDCIGDCFYCTDIIYYNTNICRKTATWNFSAHNTFNQSFFCALWVFRSCNKHFHISDIGNFFLH